MPHFYFHLRSGDQCLIDPEGGEHESLDAAREDAILSARAMMSEDIKVGILDLDQRFELHDESGHFLLAVAFADAVQVRLRGIAPDATDAAGWRMAHALIIEDDFLVATFIESALRELGFATCTIAMTEAEAIDAAQGRCPDLITSDVRLAPGNGIDAVIKICRAARIPVVFVTASAEMVLERVSTPTIVKKPFGRAELYAGILRARELAAAA